MFDWIFKGGIGAALAGAVLFVAGAVGVVTPTQPAAVTPTDTGAYAPVDLFCPEGWTETARDVVHTDGSATGAPLIGYVACDGFVDGAKTYQLTLTREGSTLRDFKSGTEIDGPDKARILGAP